MVLRKTGDPASQSDPDRDEHTFKGKKKMEHLSELGTPQGTSRLELRPRRHSLAVLSTVKCCSRRCSGGCHGCRNKERK